MKAVRMEPDTYEAGMQLLDFITPALVDGDRTYFETRRFLVALFAIKSMTPEQQEAFFHADDPRLLFTGRAVSQAREYEKARHNRNEAKALNRIVERWKEAFNEYWQVIDEHIDIPVRGDKSRKVPDPLDDLFEEIEKSQESKER